METPVLSLVTGTVNRPESYKRLVESIEKHTTVPYELVVSDASDDPVYTQSSARIVVLPERPRTTCVQGYNRAFRKARGQWVLFLNDDSEVLPGYDRNAIQFMESNPRIGLGALHYSEAGGPFHVNSAWQTLYANFGILKRSVGEEVGWFDEDLIMYGSDNSLAIRILMADYGVADIPDAKVLHHSVKDQVRAGNQVYRSRDNDTLTRKYMPLSPLWRQTFQKYRIPSGSVPWSHGVDPYQEANCR